MFRIARKVRKIVSQIILFDPSLFIAKELHELFHASIPPIQMYDIAPKMFWNF